MIRKFTPDKNKKVSVEGDYLMLPFWRVETIFTSKRCLPFIYGITESGKKFVLVGERGGTHNGIISDNREHLHSLGLSLNRNDYLCGRIWYLNSLSREVPDGLITLWDNECPDGYSNGPQMAIIKELLNGKKINVSGFEIITMDKDGDDYNVYTIPIEEYIKERISNTNEIPDAYKRQEKRHKRSHGYMKHWDEFDYKNQGVGSLGYHLTAYMDENNCKKKQNKMKKILDEEKLTALVYECAMEYIKKSPELRKRLMEKREENKKVVKESKGNVKQITYDMLFEMVKESVKRLLK